MSELPAGAYRAPLAPAEAELRDRGSRFRAQVLPVICEEDASRELERRRRRHPSATHHCWAWRIGAEPRQRWSDDGEPAGTAGAPILRVLAGAGLSDVLIVVMRWFGGTKLGKGGLARAYGGAAREALADLRVETRLPATDLVVEAPYSAVGALKRLVRPPEIELVDEQYGESVRLVLKVADHLRSEFESALSDLRLAAKRRGHQP